MKEMISIIVTGTIFLVIGMLCLFRTREIQNWGLRSYTKSKDVPSFNPFLGYMKSEAYIVVTRIIGIMCLGVFILMAYALLRE